MVVSGVQLAQSSMERVDNIVNEVSNIQNELSDSMSKLEIAHKTLADKGETYRRQKLAASRRSFPARHLVGSEVIVAHLVCRSCCRASRRER
jgi:hypothetical protein